MDSSCNLWGHPCAHKSIVALCCGWDGDANKAYRGATAILQVFSLLMAIEILTIPFFEVEFKSFPTSSVGC